MAEELDTQGEDLGPNDPRTLEEWGEYIGGLSGLALWDQDRAANTLTYVMTLQEEGYGPDEITQIMIMWAKRFLEDSQDPPIDIPGQYLSYPDLLDSIGA